MKKRLSQKQIAAVVQTGCASFVSRQIRSFQEIEIPSVAVSLDVSDNQIADFVGFEPQISFETLNVDNNPIVSFHGFPSQQMIIHFSAKQTPIAELPNFRQLALLAIGTQLETINGTQVTQAELHSVTGRNFAEYFFRKTITKISQSEQDQITSQLSDAVRRGYIASRFPRQLSTIAEAVTSQESDPITVRAMRLMNILHKDEGAIKELMKRMFCPVLPNKSTNKAQIVDERLAKQQSLIWFMTDQLNEIKKNRQQKLEELGQQKEEQLKETTDQPKKAEEESTVPVSNETLKLYNHMVEEAAGILIKNSEEFLIEEEKEKRKSHKGLRTAVINLLGVSDELSDKELANLLYDQKEMLVIESPLDFNNEFYDDDVKVKFYRKQNDKPADLNQQPEEP